jgi:hypothetical protein
MTESRQHLRLRASRLDGRAPTCYPSSPTFLQFLATTLDRSHAYVLANSDNATSIRDGIDLVREPVEELTRNIIEKFELKLRAQATKGWQGAIRGGLRKAQWALWISRKAKDLREKIAMREDSKAIQYSSGCSRPLKCCKSLECSYLIISSSLSDGNSATLSEARKVLSDIPNKLIEDTVLSVLEHSIKPGSAQRPGQMQRTSNATLVQYVEEVPHHALQDMVVAPRCIRAEDTWN